MASAGLLRSIRRHLAPRHPVLRHRPEPLHAWERAERDTRRLYAVNDAHGLHANFRATTPEAIRRELEPFRDTDFGRIYWECGMGDLLYYPGNAGRIPVPSDPHDTSDCA